MNNLEIMAEVETNGAVLFRPRKDPHEKGQEWQYDVKPLSTGRKKSWMIVDSFTVSAMRAVYNVLSGEDQATWNTKPFSRLVSFCWKHTRL